MTGLKSNCRYKERDIAVRICLVSFMLALSAMFPAPAGAKLREWTCTYAKVANINGVADDQALKVTFTIDDSIGKATMAGAAGASAVDISAGPQSITFFERQANGAIQITSIDASGTSVQSRHRLVSGKLLPSQSYGQCVSKTN